MTPITIAGKEYPWPEGCKHFAHFAPDSNHAMKGKPIFQMSDTEGDWWFIEDNYCPVAILAAVAARHFRNKAKAYSERFLHVTKAEVGAMNLAAEQWEILCNDL